nr:hypothetical protein [Pedobacter sp. ASV2]
MMKINKHCLLFCVVLLNIQCIAQVRSKKIIIPIVDKDFEKFDSIKYENRLNKTSSVLREFLSDGAYIELHMAKAGFAYLSTSPNSYFTTMKEYYQNRNIKFKGAVFNAGDFRKGIWYEFNENGQLIKETNYDKYYKFTFEDILKFCEREHIEVKKGPILQSTGFHTAIRRGYSLLMDNVSWWEIDWLKRSDLIETIKLNGNTGVVVEKIERSYINN